MTRPAVFLDRDGTIIEERNYLDRLDDLALFPWTIDALRLLKRAGFVTAVITNQSAVARGIIEESFVHEVHREIDRRLDGTGAAIDAVRKGQVTVYRRSKVALGVAPVLTGRIQSVSAWVRV